MTETIKIRPVDGTWVVRAAGAVLGETTHALELTEGDYPPVIYIPRADIAMAFFDLSEMTSSCPHKGTATYYSIIAKSGELKDSAWSYETPHHAIAQIKGHLAFYPDKVTVEQI